MAHAVKIHARAITACLALGAIAAAPAQAFMPADSQATTQAAQATPAAEKAPERCVDRVMPVDPVLLLEGREVPGSPELIEIHEGTTYQFSSPQTHARFKKDPARFAAADGGTCGRMGALAGLGDARRSMVHDGRLYFFASDQCRATFAKAPARFIATPDPVPTGTDDEIKAGMAIVDRWVAWSGGADAVRAATHAVLRSEVPPTEENGNWKVERIAECRWGSDAQQLSIETWTRAGEKPAVHRYEMGANRAGAWQRSGEGEKEDLAPARAAAFARHMAHQPLVLLRARFEPGFVAVADGQCMVNGAVVDRVRVAYAGATLRLCIDRSTGALISAHYRDRDPNLVVADLTHTFTAFSEAGGLKVPVEWSTLYAPFDDAGKPVPPAEGTAPTRGLRHTLHVAR